MQGPLRLLLLLCVSAVSLGGVHYSALSLYSSAVKAKDTKAQALLERCGWRVHEC
jgi:hypothetical protein